MFSRNKIQVSKEETLEKLSEWEMINQKLKGELKESAQQLIARSNELASSKTELQRHRQEIDVSLCVCAINVSSAVIYYLISLVET